MEVNGDLLQDCGQKKLHFQLCNRLLLTSGILSELFQDFLLDVLMTISIWNILFTYPHCWLANYYLPLIIYRSAALPGSAGGRKQSAALGRPASSVYVGVTWPNREIPSGSMLMRLSPRRSENDDTSATRPVNRVSVAQLRVRLGPSLWMKSHFGEVPLAVLLCEHLDFRRLWSARRERGTGWALSESLGGLWFDRKPRLNQPASSR